jgi:hypothetical protein
MTRHRDQIRYCLREFEDVEQAMSITLDMSYDEVVPLPSSRAQMRL